MAEIVDLDALVGGDLIFKYNAEELKIPGDLSTKAVFELFQAFKEMTDLSSTKDPDKVERATTLIHTQLLSLFQIRQPDMKELPFGVKTLPVVIKNVLSILGVTAEDDEDRPPARSRAQASKRKATTKSSQKKQAARSRRSSGSQSS